MQPLENALMLRAGPSSSCMTPSASIPTSAHGTQLLVRSSDNLIIRLTHYRWYNTTYILYAASIILCYATRAAPLNERPDLYQYVDLSIEVLEVMEESVVAKKAAQMIRQIVNQARESAPDSDTPKAFQQQNQASQVQSASSSTFGPTHHGYMNDAVTMQMSDVPIGSDMDLGFASLPLEDTQFSLWTDFADTIGDFWPS